MNVRPATRDDLIRFYGTPPVNRVRAWVAEDEGEIVGVAGIVYTGRPIMFSDMREPLKARKVFLVKAAKDIVRWAREKRIPLAATPDPRESNPERFLQYLGFVPSHEVDGTTVYVLGESACQD